MTALDEYTQTPISKKLHELLKKVSSNEHFINGVLMTLDSDDQRKILIEELENGLDDTGIIILMADDIADGLEV